MKYVARAFIVLGLLSFTAACWWSALNLAVAHGDADSVWSWLLISLGTIPTVLMYKGIWNYLTCQYTIREAIELWT